jgi:hypothetical protein
MPRPRDLELAQRQQELLLRSAALRATLGQQARVLQTPLAVADQVRSGVNWVRGHSLWPLVSLLLLTVARPRRTLRWASHLWLGQDLYRHVRGWLSKKEKADSGAGQPAATGPSDQP